MSGRNGKEETGIKEDFAQVRVLVEECMKEGRQYGLTSADRDYIQGMMGRPLASREEMIADTTERWLMMMREEEEIV